MKKPMMVCTLVLSALLAGCLVEETTHTLYLEPDGRVSWMVVQSEVRSRARTADERAAEERQFLLEVEAFDHGVARAFRALGGHDIDGWILRERSPLTVVTRGRFESIESLAQRIVEGLGCPCWTELREEVGLQTLLVTIVIDDEGCSEDDDAPVLSLVADREDYRLILPEGRFVSARGFVLEENGRVALLDELDEDALAANGGVLTLELSWKGVD